MPSTPFTAFTSTYVVLPVDNIDTDQIIPARFLKTTLSTGLGAAAFADWRYRSDGMANPDFALNSPRAAGAQVLVTGVNFGCGSSREHAVWALLGAGFRAVVSAGFADIFHSNALGNGLLPIRVERAIVQRLTEAAEHDPAARLGVDIESQMLTLPNGDSVTFPIAPFAKYCLVNGVDELDFLLRSSDDVDAFEKGHRTFLQPRTA